MRGAKQPFVSPPPPPPPSPLQPLRDIETAYSKVSRRDAQWMISPLGHIYYPNLGTVRARLCGLHSPQIARPTAPVFLRMQIERSRAIRQPSHLTPHHHTTPYRGRFLFFLPLPLPAPNTIRDRGWRSNNNNNDCNARGRA